MNTHVKIASHITNYQRGNMANIMSVRQFVQGYRDLKPGTEVVVVNGSRRKIVAAFEVKEAPEQIEKRISLIFRR